MSVAEQFTAGLGTILGIQATPIQNVTTISIVDMHIAQSNAAPERHGRILLNVDGVLYEIRFSFAEETNSGMRAGSSISVVHLAIDPNTAGKSSSWNASRSRMCRPTCPTNTIIGEESWRAM